MMSSHGLSKARIYKTWANIVQSKNHVPEWREFASFYQDVGDPPTDRSIFARPNPQVPYGPTNFEWRSRKVHAGVEGGRRSRRVHGLSLSEWAAKTGVAVNTIKRRIRRGWKLEDAVTTNLVSKTDERRTKKKMKAAKSKDS